MNVHQFGVFEAVLDPAQAGPASPAGSPAVVPFTSPSGRLIQVAAFGDGGSTWRVRFSPDEVGRWVWRPHPSEAALTFECVPYEGTNPLYRHGPLRLSSDRRSLRCGDGSPFFWLADTAWNGVIRAGDSDWRRYLECRQQQRFNVIQFVACTWRGDVLDEAGEPAFEGEDPIRINPRFFQRLDRRIAMINEHGLVAAPVVLWSLLESDPGRRLSEPDATRLASYIVSRYDAYQVVWFLGGDGVYRQTGVDRWKRIGQSVFQLGHNRLATLHPCGESWIGDDFRTESWYDIIGYQSGHGDSHQSLRWLVNGPPAQHWNNEPPLPLINLEPNYETAPGYTHGTVFTDYHVRRAAYWSLLIAPPAGVTYGHDSIWNWNAETGPSEGHSGWHGGRIPPWHTALETPGIRSMTVMRGIFEQLDWTTLRPDPSLLARQPGDEDPAAFVAAARSADGTAVIYTPRGGSLPLAASGLNPGTVRIIDPKTGEAKTIVGPGQAIPSALTLEDGDWLVTIER